MLLYASLVARAAFFFLTEVLHLANGVTDGIINVFYESKATPAVAAGGRARVSHTSQAGSDKIVNCFRVVRRVHDSMRNS